MTKPRELQDAETVLSLLERFPGYTLSTLMEEDSELIRLVAIRAAGTRQEEAQEGEDV